MAKISISKEMFLLNLAIMKEILDLVSLKFDKKSNEYKIFKKEIMNITYTNLRTFYKKLVKENILKICTNKCDLRQGWDKCSCGGCGFIEKE